ncbi:MAG: PilZ domain-containing protein [Acetivibrio sp.]
MVTSMVTPTLIAPGTKFNMISLKNNYGEKSDAKQFSSKVLDLMEEETIKIAMPTEKNVMISLETGEKYLFIFYTKKGLYQCKGEIIERFKDGRISVCTVHMETDLEKYQRRQYYRLEHVMNIQYRRISQEQVPWSSATIIDISGGGCRFNSTEEMQSGQLLELEIGGQFQGKEQNRIYKGIVVLSKAIEMKMGYFEHRIEFTELDILERENLIQYIFKEERKIRSKERGTIG